MTRLSVAVVFGSLALAAANAQALDIPLDADGLQLRRTLAGREFVELVVRDKAVVAPVYGGADDPSLPDAGALLELFGGNGSYAALPIPGGTGWPGWPARRSATPQR